MGVMARPGEPQTEIKERERQLSVPGEGDPRP
jgi:hypothetical protein